MNGKIVALVIAVLAIIGIGWYLAQPREEPQPVLAGPALPPPAQEEVPMESGVIERDETMPPAPAPVAVPPPAQLENSDQPAREAASELGPKLVAWMTPEEQVRKWVLLVDLAAEGKVPGKNRPLAYPMAAFKVEGAGEGRFRPDQANHGRAGDLVEVLINIPPQRAADYYRAWRPLLQQAYEELGKPGTFDERLRLAIEHALAVEPLQQPPELTRPNVFYTYADPQLEKASDVEKLMWRLGPENMRALQTFLREFQAQL